MKYLLLTLLVACGGNAFVGRIVDDAGAPVAKAEVSTEPATDIVLTKTNGVFTLRQVVDPTGEVGPIANGKYVITVRKLGFIPLEIEVVAEGGTSQLGERTLPNKSIEITPTAPTPTPQHIDPTNLSTPVDGDS